MKSPVLRAKEGVLINLYVQPGAAKAGWAGVFDGQLKLKVQARAVEGQANEAVCKFVAKYFDIPGSAVAIVKGERSRSKVVLVAQDVESVLHKAQAIIQSQQAT